MRLLYINDMAFRVGLQTSYLQDITHHIGSHSVTCHPTQVNAPRLNPSKKGWYSTDLYSGGYNELTDLLYMCGLNVGSVGVGKRVCRYAP